MVTYRHWSVSLWQDPDNVSHCWILSPDKTEWQLISATLCRRRRCFVAVKLWFVTHIREEEEVTGWDDWYFAPVKRLSGKIVSDMTYNVSNGTLNHTILYYTVGLASGTTSRLYKFHSRNLLNSFAHISNKWCGAQQISPRSPLQGLAPGDFTGIIPQPLPIICESFVTTAISVFPYLMLLINRNNTTANKLANTATKNNTLSAYCTGVSLELVTWNRQTC